MHATYSLPTRPASSLLRAGHATSAKNEPSEDELLTTLRRITNSPRASSLSHRIGASASGNGADEELAWTRTRVVLSVGSCVRRQWDFQHEEQEVQYACWAYVEHASSLAQAPTNASSDAANATAAANAAFALDAHNFGPFARSVHDQQRAVPPSVRVRALFVFLRSVGKVFLESGIEYTFHLPFITRRAWAMHPRGVLIERVAGPRRSSRPSLYALTDPLAEVLPVGVGDSLSRYSIDVHDYSTALPPSERVLTVLERVEPLPCSIIITLNGPSKLTLWRVDINKGTSHVPDIHSPTAHSQMPTSASTFSMYHPSNESQSRSLGGLPSSVSLASLSTAVGPSQGTQPWAAMSPRADLSMAMDRMALASRTERDVSNMSASQVFVEGGAFLEKLFSCDLSFACSTSEGLTTAFLFDVQQHPWGWSSRIGLHLQSSAMLVSMEVKQYHDTRLMFSPPQYTPCLSAARIAGIRPHGEDVLIFKPDHSLAYLAFGLREVSVDLDDLATKFQADTSRADQMETADDASNTSMVDKSGIKAVTDVSGSSFTVVFEDGAEKRVALEHEPRDSLTRDCFAALAFALPAQDAFELHKAFVAARSSGDLPDYLAFRTALFELLRIANVSQESASHSWDIMDTGLAMRNDPALQYLQEPPGLQTVPGVGPVAEPAAVPTMHHAPVLYALHLLGQEYLLSAHRANDLKQLADLLITLSRQVRPSWADYWVRLSAGMPRGWQAPQEEAAIFDAVPHHPPDIFEHLHARLTETQVASWPTLAELPKKFSMDASMENGSSFDPMVRTHQLLQLYAILADRATESSTQRCETAVRAMVAFRWTLSDVDDLPLGAGAPVREALRACQLAPPGDWPAEAYVLVGRADLARMNVDRPVVFQPESTPAGRKRVLQIIEEMRAGILTDVKSASGVDLNIGGFTDIRFGQDRRLHEVARMLQSSTPPSVTMLDRADISEHDLAREQQQLVLRVSERTLALPLGRALFTFGTVSTVKRDAYVIPKLEFDVRIQPQNTTLTAEVAKIPTEAKNWAEFHNGVAAGLRIAPAANAIDSAWIASNKPSDLTPQHAGFLFGLGLTGHLKSMLTWHTFSYLTPKHDLTSVGILLGLASANVGTANRNVTKLIAVHTPALLPTPTVDLNIPLIIQAAGLSGLGLLYLGTNNRHMAEVSLTEIGRRQPAQAEPVQEIREAYAVSAAFAFGMIMIGKRSETLSPADLDFVERLRTYIHGLPPSASHSSRPQFNVNITSPAATIALALMFLKSERADMAELVALPHTTAALDHIPPYFLLLRTLTKALIMWNDIGCSREWVRSQVPPDILRAMQKPRNVANDPLELAYYHIAAGACFAMGLKYAGSAQKEAHDTLLGFFDIFTQRAEQPVSAFEHKIRRAAVQDGLNLIAIAVGLVMAGTGDVPSLRRLRMIHGQSTWISGYGVHAASHMAMGLLFLGGGRYTLGTSNAAVACMLASFFPRFPRSSGDSNGYVQALRHMWVLAVEPRCLIACDVDTDEVVYLPLNLKVRSGDGTRTKHLVSPTLIPEIDTILSIVIDSPRYWPLHINLQDVPQHRATLLRTQTIFVKKKTGFLGYGDDPKGSRSIVLRPGTSEAAVVATPYVSGMKWTLYELHNFVKSLKGNKHLVAFLDYLCRRTVSQPSDRQFHLFATAVLLECLTLDKLHVLHSHLRLYLPMHDPIPPHPSAVAIKDLILASSFYKSAFPTLFAETLKAGGAPLFSSSIIADLNQSLRSAVRALRASDSFRSALAKYSHGHAVDLAEESEDLADDLAAYLVAENVPSASALVALRALAFDAAQRHSHTVIRTLLHLSAAKLQGQTTPTWSLASLSDIIASWT